MNNSNPRLMQWSFTKPYQFLVEHKQGRDNQNVENLYRQDFNIAISKEGEGNVRGITNGMVSGCPDLKLEHYSDHKLESQ